MALTSARSDSGVRRGSHNASAKRHGASGMNASHIPSSTSPVMVSRFGRPATAARIVRQTAGRGERLKVDAVLAEQTGRRAYAMEPDPLYSDVIVQRFEQFTAQKAERTQR